MTATRRSHAHDIPGREGFTLIELLIVILVVSVLSSIAVAPFSQARERAHFATIEQDFRNLGASQERYHQASMRYATDLGLLDFGPSPGVEVEVIEATASGWSAMGTHTALSAGKGCSVYLGDATPPPVPGGGQHQGGAGVLQCSQE